MSYVSTSFPCTQEWSSTSQRTWVGTEGPVDAPVGPMNWDDWNMQLGLLSDLCKNRDQRPPSQLLPIKRDINKFEIRLDLSHFSPEEFNVKIVDKELVVECKHEEKKDEFGWVSRQFTRKFALPDDVDLEKVTSTLSSAGILTVEVPKKVFQTKEENVVFIPIIHEKDLVNTKDQNKSESSKDSQQTSDLKSTDKKTENTEKSEINIEVKTN